MPLTPQQKRFAEEYVVDLNATEAAKRAGYSQKTARTKGSWLLTKVDIRAEIDRLLAEKAARTAVTADRVVKEMALIAFSDIGDILDFSGTEVRLKPAN